MPGLYDVLNSLSPQQISSILSESGNLPGLINRAPDSVAFAPQYQSGNSGFSFANEAQSGGGGAGGGSLFGLVNGIGQLLKSKRIHPVRPKYEIPEETKNMLGLRQNLLNAGMPGEQQVQQDIYTNQANTLSGLARSVSDQGQYLSMLGATQGQTNNALNNLATQRAQNYYRNLSGLEQAQQLMASAKDKEWELNKLDPYLMQMQQKYQLQNAGNQNIASGIGSLESAAMAFL